MGKIIVMKIGIFILFFSLTACSVNPFYPEGNHFTGNTAGPIIGATAGTATAILLHAPKPLILSAGLLGAGIGYYATTLRFASGGIIQGDGQVYVVGDYVGINLPSDNLFDTNSAELLLEATPILDSVVAVLQRYPDHSIIISGNTSGFYSEHLERKISRARAKCIANYLQEHGIAASLHWKNIGNNHNDSDSERRKLIYVGYGNYFPIANDIRAESLRENSRIQITAYPPKDQALIDKKMIAFGNIGHS